MEVVKNRDIIKPNLKYPEDFINKIIYGDCLEMIKLIPDNSIDAIITDPPYGLNKNGVRNDADLSLFYNILPECDRVLKNNSFFVTFFSIKFLPQLFKNNPFNYFWQIVLYCPEGRVKSPIGYTKYMSCFILKKGNPKIIRWNKDIFVDTPGKMVEPDEGYIDHPTPKPKHFIKEILKMFAKDNDLILDPFIGSGSTAVACLQLNRKFIGFEIEEKYCKIALEKGKKDTKLTSKHFVGSNGKEKYPYELSEIFFKAMELKFITKKDVENLLNEISDYKSFIDEKAITVEHHSQLTINGIKFEEASIKLPTLFMIETLDETQIEVSIQKQQYASGVQPMVYFCIPLKAFKNSSDLLGKSSISDDKLVYVINKTNVLNLIFMMKVFGMASKRHNHDVVKILETLLEIIDR